MLFHELLFDRIASHADRTALIRGDDRLSYAAVGEQAQALAQGLHGIGLRPNERVAVYLNKRPEGVVGYFAISLCAAVFVPVNPVLKPDQVRHILNDCDVSVLITSAAQAQALRLQASDCPALRSIVLVDDASNADASSIDICDWATMLDSQRPSVRLPNRIDNDMAAILYTSGSTGKPKGVVLSHRNMVMGAVSVARYLNNTDDDVILAALPFSFDAGFSQLSTGFSVGAAVILMDYLLPRDVPKAIARHGATALTGVPPLWNQLAKLDWPDDAVTSLRYIANTGGAMPTATLDKLRQLLPETTVFLMYGLTESFRSTYLAPEELDQRPTSIGKAIPNAEILVVRDDGTLCEPGEPGELVHRGALVSLGYWNDPERTAQRFRPLPNLQSELPFAEMTVWSGDTVTKDEDGFLYFVGRKDDMIKSSGYRISPTEVEEVVYATGLVSECAALGIPHPDIGQAVVIVAHASGADEGTSDAIIKACKQSLPNFMVPERIIWQDNMPKNPNGKIDRKQLTSEYGNLYQD